MFELNVDPNFPHHYIIGVAMHTLHSKTPGKMFLKYGPVYFTNDDVERVGDSIILSKDKIYRKIYNMKPSQIYKTNQCSELIMALTGLKMAAQANHATLHHFSSEVEMLDAEEYFEWLVDFANKPESEERKKLDESRIKGY
jgi:hypothetical protein